eukprot:3792543-Pyramimonas_sp.AAC.1
MAGRQSTPGLNPGWTLTLQARLLRLRRVPPRRITPPLLLRRRIRIDPPPVHPPISAVHLGAVHVGGAVAAGDAALGAAVPRGPPSPAPA